MSLQSYNWKKSFVSVISNAPADLELAITQVDDHVKMRLISQLINGMSRVIKKLLNYFNGTVISTTFVLSLAGVSPVIFILNLDDSDCTILLFG